MKTHIIYLFSIRPSISIIVRDLQSVIGKEIKTQILEKICLIDAVVACIGGSNAIETFYPFVNEKVKLYGVEAAGKGVDTKTRTCNQQ